MKNLKKHVFLYEKAKKQRVFLYKNWSKIIGKVEKAHVFVYMFTFFTHVGPILIQKRLFFVFSFLMILER